jgi:hypothetical protein
MSKSSTEARGTSFDEVFCGMLPKLYARAAALTGAAQGGEDAVHEVYLKLPPTSRVLGVDWGVKETATTTSDAHDLPHAEHGRKAQKKLTRYDRMMARRRPKKGQPGSKGYREAKKLRAKAYKKVARQRADTGRKWAKKVVRDHDAVAVEDFRPKFLAKSTMAPRTPPSVPPRPLWSRWAASTGGTSVWSTPRTHDGLRQLRCESQVRTAAGWAHLHLYRMRSRDPTGQELRMRDAPPGWSQPGWC